MASSLIASSLGKFQGMTEETPNEMKRWLYKFEYQLLREQRVNDLCTLYNRDSHMTCRYFYSQLIDKTKNQRPWITRARLPGQLVAGSDFIALETS